MVYYNIKKMELYIWEIGGMIELLKEFWDFLKVRKRYWLAPIIITLLLLAALFIFAGNAGVISPFIYAL